MRGHRLIGCAIGIGALLVAGLAGPARADDASDGAALFQSRCAVCHDATGKGLVGPDIRCHRSIADAVRKGRVTTKATMPAMPDLTDAAVAQLQTWLRSQCPAPDGATLYRTHCARCHGADALGTGRTPPAACATRLTDALTRGRDTAMPAMPGLTPDEVASVQGWLDQRCAARKAPADLVWAANCGTCHGVNGGGGKNALWNEGPDVRCTAHDDFLDAIERGWGGMPKFPALTRATNEALFRRVHARRCPKAP